jgi:hypothetical protein
MNSSNNPSLMAGQDRQSQSTELPGRYTTQKEVQQWFSCIVQTTPKDDLDPEKTQLTLHESLAMAYHFVKLLSMEIESQEI